MSPTKRKWWLIGLLASVSGSASAGAATWNPASRPTERPDPEHPADAPRPTPPPRWLAEFLASDLSQRHARRLADVIGPDGDESPAGIGDRPTLAGPPAPAAWTSVAMAPVGPDADRRLAFVPAIDAPPAGGLHYRPGLPHGPPTRR